MNHVYVRPLRIYDEQDKYSFIRSADACGKEFPKDVFTLPSTRIMVAEKGGEILMYQPHFVSLNLGSLIPVGSITAGEFASAQHMLTGAAFTRAHSEGFADIIAMSNDPSTQKFAKRHGYVSRPETLYLEVR